MINRMKKGHVVGLMVIWMSVCLMACTPGQDEDTQDEGVNMPSDEELGVVEYSFGAGEGICEIEIDSEYSTVHILNSDEVDAIEVFGQKGSEEDTIEATVDDGVLYITEDEKHGLDLDKPADNSFLRITIPTSMEIDILRISSDAGIVSYNATTQLQTFVCEIDAGTFCAEQINAESADISVDVGTIEVNQCYAENLEIQCNVGKVQVEEVTVKKAAKVSCDAGKVFLEMVGKATKYGFALENGLGTIRIDGEEIEGDKVYYNDYQDAECKVDISCDVGSVKVEFTDE